MDIANLTEIVKELYINVKRLQVESLYLKQKGIIPDYRNELGGGTPDLPVIEEPTTKQNSYVTITETQGRQWTLTIYKTYYDGMLEFSNDGINWQYYDLNNWRNIHAVSNSEGKLYIRGSGNTTFSDGNWESDDIYATLGLNGEEDSTFRIDGNIETLLDYETVERGEHPYMGANCFAYFFHESKIVNCPELPATDLSLKCYQSMFFNCSELIDPPSKLPATELATECYDYMFEGCGKLKGEIHCPKSLENDIKAMQLLDTNSTATLVFDL